MNRQESLLLRQVELLEQTESQTSLQLNEANATLDRVREEEQASKQCVEYLAWKLQMTTNQMSLSNEKNVPVPGARRTPEH